jgi:Xaa-Pro aminopeptidase
LRNQSNPTHQMKAQNSPEELAAVKHAAENLANLAAR